MPSNLDDKEDKNGQLFIYAYLVKAKLIKRKKNQTIPS